MRIPFLVFIAGCALTGLHGPATAAPAADDPTDLRLRTYETQQAEIKALNDTGRFPVKNYALAKAQCWLDVSFHEFTRNDRSQFPPEAWTQSHRITEELKASGESATAASTPLVNHATRLRPDLWDKLDGLKGAPGFACAQSLVACAEVELVHAGNEYHQIGWRHAKPYVQIAEDRTAEAAQAATDHCAAAASDASAAATPTPLAVAAEPPASAAPHTEHVSIAATALFKFDRRQAKDLLPAGRAQLDALAARITNVYADVHSISLIGHTDRLGSRPYNEKLALDRANAVRQYLTSKGLSGPFTTQGDAGGGQLTECRGRVRSAALHRCLQPDRRVDIVIVGALRDSAAASVDPSKSK